MTDFLKGEDRQRQGPREARQRGLSHVRAGRGHRGRRTESPSPTLSLKMGKPRLKEAKQLVQLSGNS